MSEALPAWWAIPIALGFGGLGIATAAAADFIGSAPARSLPRSFSAPFRESARLLRQPAPRTVAADLLLWRCATSSFVPISFAMVALVPLGTAALVAMPLGIVWFNTLDVTVWAAVWLTGWGANSAYSLIGGYRFLGMALAYELPLMFALVAPAVAASSLDPAVVAASQSGVWYVVWMPVAFVVYCVGVLGFSMQGFMSAPVSDDIAGGAVVEVSGVDRLLVESGRWLLLVAGAAFAVPLFLGGGSGPVLPAPVWVVLKTGLMAIVLVTVSRRLPVLRPDLFVEIGWTILLPAVVLQDLVVGLVASQ